MINIKVIPPDVNEPQKLESPNLDLITESYEASRGTALDWTEDSPGRTGLRSFLGMNMVELDFVVNMNVVYNCLSFPTI